MITDSATLPWERRTSWTELCTTVPPDTEAHLDGRGAVPVVSGRFAVGRPDDPDAPLVFRTFFPPGNVTPVHSHRVNYSEWILDGTREITRKWYRAGDIQVATAGTFYGPLIAGPGGVLVFALFATQRYQPISVEQAREEGVSQHKYFFKGAWDDLYQNTEPSPDGSMAASYVVGEPDDLGAPVVMKTFSPPGASVNAHLYRCPFAQIIFAGTLSDGETEYRAGDIRIATPGAVDRPMVAGPIGADVFTIFANSSYRDAGARQH